MDISNYQPIHDRVLIKPTPAEEMLGNFAILAKEQERKHEGTVMAVGPGVPLHNVQLSISGEATEEILERIEDLIFLIKEGRPMMVKPGDYVLYGQYAGTEVKINDQKYIMVREADVFCIIKKD